MFFTEQFIRSGIASISATSVAHVVNGFTLYNYKVDNNVVTFISLFVIGNILSYSFDIMFAKKYFNNVIIPYNRINDRLMYLIKSYVSHTFAKYVMTVIIDVILIYTLHKYIVNYCNKNKIDFKYRNSIIASILSTSTFVLFINQIRFNWAYNINSDINIDIIMYAWLGLSVLIFCSNL